MQCKKNQIALVQESYQKREKQYHKEVTCFVLHAILFTKQGNNLLKFFDYILICTDISVNFLSRFSHDMKLSMLNQFFMQQRFRCI